MIALESPCPEPRRSDVLDERPVDFALQLSLESSRPTLTADVSTRSRTASSLGAVREIALPNLRGTA